MPRSEADLVRTSTKRSKAGCHSCRRTRIKCDEVHPSCGRCQARSLLCEWPEEITSARKHRNPRVPTSCDFCRRRKLRCDSQGGTCQQCVERGEVCERMSGLENDNSGLPAQDDLSGFGADFPGRQPLYDPVPIIQDNHDVGGFLNLQASPSRNLPAMASDSSTVGPIPEDVNVKDLVKLYFASVHHFGYLSFIHEADYWELSERGRAPPELTTLMAAHALRFGGQPSSAARLHLADQWVSEVGNRLISRVMDEFGVVELMGMVLCQTYDFLAGRYSRGMVMAGMAVRMMTFLRLHELDEWPRQGQKLLLSRESLRRLAWSVWFLDATLDGGVFGASTIQEHSYTIQLPCDDRPFLLHKHVVTESLIPSGQSNPGLGIGSDSLDISAHLIRAMYARQALAQVHSLIQRHLIGAEHLRDRVSMAEQKAKSLLITLASDLRYTRALYHIYRDRRPTVVLLHVVRNNCERHAALLRLLLAQHAPNESIDVTAERRTLIACARTLSHILTDALDYHVPLDPQIAMHAYNAVEILLFQPARLCSSRSAEVLPRVDALQSLRPLIQVIRRVASVCPLVALIYPEAINRMVQMGYIDELHNEDIMAVLQKVHCFTHADQEFDWTESFWRYEVFLSRRARTMEQNQGQDSARLPDPAVQDQPAESPEDGLLEVPSPAGNGAGASPSMSFFSPFTVTQQTNIVDTSQSGGETITLAELIRSSEWSAPIPPSEVVAATNPLSRLQDLFDLRNSNSNTPAPAPMPNLNDPFITDHSTSC